MYSYYILYLYLPAPCVWLGGRSYQDMRLASRSFFKRWLACDLAKITFLYIKIINLNLKLNLNLK